MLPVHVLVVGEQRVGLRPEEVPVPDAEQRQDHLHTDGKQI